MAPLAISSIMARFLRCGTFGPSGRNDRREEFSPTIISSGAYVPFVISSEANVVSGVEKSLSVKPRFDDVERERVLDTEQRGARQCGKPGEEGVCRGVFHEGEEMRSPREQVML